MKSLLIVDDHPLFLKGMALMLEKMLSDFSILTTDTFPKAQEIIQEQEPDLILLDLMMPDCDKFSCLRLLVDDYPSLPIVILSSSEKAEHIEQAIEYGAQGYIPKTSNPDEMLMAISDILIGKYYIPTQCSELKSRKAPALKYKLSSRQLEILSLVSQGLSNKIIASSLHIAEGTVKQHLSAIFKIMQVKNRTMAARLGERYLDL